jgi:hypothetical protein
MGSVAAEVCRKYVTYFHFRNKYSYMYAIFFTGFSYEELDRKDTTFF